MPVYVYQCPTCGQFEQRQSFNDPALQTCSTCGQPVRRLIRPAPIVFKGSGWYSTDKRNGASGSANGAKTADETVSGAGETKKTEATPTETKPEPVKTEA